MKDEYHIETSVILNSIVLLYARILDYYRVRGLKWPDVDDALSWALTEYAEVIELRLANKGGWIRNNPEDKEPYSDERFAEEIGDTIMMLLIAAMGKGIDPIAALINKMDRKMDEAKRPSVN